MSATGIAPKQGFYVTGGTMRRDAPSYVERQADRILYESLMQGKFCYALTSRQMGKSSLMVRTAARLREDGVGVAVLRAVWQEQNNRRLLYVSHMKLAQQAWESANVGQVEELLKMHLPYAGGEDLRGFEWYYLWRLSHRFSSICGA